jgi:hypothetical protein
MPKYQVGTQKKIGSYKAFPILSRPFESISIDFMTYFLEWEGTDAIFVVVDRSKLAKFVSIQTNLTMAGTVKLLFNMWVRHNDMLEVIVSDRDVKFMSKFWILSIEIVRIKLKFSVVYHLQIDGYIERVNIILNQYYHNYSIGDHRNWGDHLG